MGLTYGERGLRRNVVSNSLLDEQSRWTIPLKTVEELMQI